MNKLRNNFFNLNLVYDLKLCISKNRNKHLTLHMGHSFF